MSFLADALGSAKSAYGAGTNSFSGLGATLGQSAQNVGQSLVASVTNPSKVTALANAAGSAAIGALGNALGQASTDAVSNILNGSSLSSIGSGIVSDLSSVGGLLTSPGGSMFEGFDLLGMQARADPLWEYDWYCVLPAIQSAYGVTTLGWNYVEECTVPYRRFETRSVYDQGFDKHYAGKYAVDTLRLGVYMDATGQSLQYFRSWQAAIMQPFPSTNAASLGGAFNVPSSYKKDVKIYLLNSARAVIAQILCTGCWPTNIDSLNLVSASGGRLIQNVTLSVDDVFMDFTGAAADIISSVINTLGNSLSGLAGQAASSFTSSLSSSSVPDYNSDAGVDSYF